MILPQLENNTHGVAVAGMFFFEDNNYVLVRCTLNVFRISREAGTCVRRLAGAEMTRCR